MDINRNNYEAYFLDFLEGRLSVGEEEILHRFLKFNPDLADELEAFDLYPLHPGKEIYPGKEDLYRRFPDKEDTIGEDNFELFCIAYLEGDLDDEQKIEFETYIAGNEKHKKELDYFKASFLSPEKIYYPGKRALKKQLTISLNWRLMTPVAAAAAILLMLLIRPSGEVQEVQIAASLPAVEEAEVVKEAVEEKKPPLKNASAAIQVIRSSKNSAPVPVNKETGKQQSGEGEKDLEKISQPEKSPSDKGIKLGKTYIAEVQPQYDRIVPVAVDPPEIHYTSLSVIDMARYQYQKASQVLEGDEPLFWNLASRGIEELNRLSGPNTELLASKDEEGNISGIHLKTRFLSFTAPISVE